MTKIDDATRCLIIIEGEEDQLVAAAETIGSDLASIGLTTSQIRGIFGTVRRIEMDWQKPTAETTSSDAMRRAQREFALLQPRLAYQARRESGQKGRGVQTLRDELLPAMKLVSEGKKVNPQVHYDRFRNFVDFFEAILAYHRAAGGKN